MTRIEMANLEDSTHATALIEILDSYARGPGGQNEPLSAETRTNLATSLRTHPGANVLLAFDDERAVGVAVCITTFSTFAAKPALNVHDLAVLPEFRGRGIGRALLAEVENVARARGCCKVSLEVHDTNEGAKKLYRELGFGPWAPTTLSLYKNL